MKLKKILLAMATFAGMTFAASAQGGSNYSMYGIGDIHNNLSARYEGMGGVSTAIPSEYAINMKNPAMWSFLTTTRVQAGYNYNLRNTEYGDKSITQSNAGVNQIAGVFQLDTARGISLTFGVMPYSSINYYIKKIDRYVDEQFDFLAETFYTGSGGMTTGFLGISSEVFDNFRLGVQGSLFFGKLSQSVRTLFYDGQNQEQLNDKNDMLSGSAVKLGLCYEPVKNFYIGAYYEKMLDLTSNCEISYDGQLNSVKNDTSYTRKYDLEMPDSYGVGLALRTGKFIIGADYSCQDFSNFKLEKSSPAQYKNAQTFALGVSRMGNRGFRADFFDKLTYNFGLGYKELYYNVNGQDVNELYGSVGFDWNVVNSMMINTAFTFGVRGKNSDGLMKETFGRININIGLGETWFKPFKPDY